MVIIVSIQINNGLNVSKGLLFFKSTLYTVWVLYSIVLYIFVPLWNVLHVLLYSCIYYLIRVMMMEKGV